VNRLWRNYLQPSIIRPQAEYLLYGNDGLADLGHWHGRRLLYWYDAPRDWSQHPPTRRQWVQYLRCRNVRLADHVFAVSAAQVELARRLRGGANSSVHYLPVGVDCEFFDPARAKPEAARTRFGLPLKTIIGYLGSLGIWEGRFAGQPLTEVAPALVRQHEVHFLIVGSGPAKETFVARVHELGLAAYFTFTGYVESSWLPHCLAAMDVCVDTLEPGFHSLARSETKLKQYMAMGRACVATGIGENRVDLDEGNCGLLVKPGAEALYEGLAALTQDPAKRVALGQAARRRAVELYAWPKLAERLVAALRLASAPPGPLAIPGPRR
jgi:glycosyltransferase involved in cell wall biosynthesis